MNELGKLIGTSDLNKGGPIGLGQPVKVSELGGLPKLNDLVELSSMD